MESGQSACAKACAAPKRITHVILSLSKDLGLALRRSFDFAQDDMGPGTPAMNHPGERVLRVSARLILRLRTYQCREAIHSAAPAKSLGLPYERL
jgi:hypothetical protein